MFLSFEGGDGCGKSTQQHRLAAWFESQNRECVLCRDPGSTALGDALREILLHRAQWSITNRAEMFLFMAARCQMVDEVIQPALAAGKIVLSDRFLMSNIVYQGLAGGVPVEILETLGQIAVKDVMPDLSIVLDLPYESAVERIGNRASPDRMERKGEEYHRRVRTGFLDYAKQNENNCLVIDATKSPDEIALLIRERVGELTTEPPLAGRGHLK